MNTYLKKIEETAKELNVTVEQALQLECVALKALASMINDNKLIAKAHLLSKLASKQITRENFELCWEQVA